MENNTEDIAFVSSWPPEDEDVESEDGPRSEDAHLDTRPHQQLTACHKERTQEPTLKRPLEDSTSDKSKLMRSSDSPGGHLADVALARWWRRAGRTLCDCHHSNTNISPHTLLSRIIKYPQAQTFLKEEIRKLECQQKRADMRWDVLGTLYERVGDYVTAYKCLLKAVQGGADNAIKWILERVMRQLRIEASQACALSHLKTPLQIPAPSQVERRSADSLSAREFFLRYEMTRTPVVITGLGASLTEVPWTLEHLKQVAGQCSVTTRRYVEGSAEWARLEDGPTLSLEAFIADIQRQEQLYLFDWSLPLHCPALAKQLTIPKYFTDDFLQRTADGTLYKDSWPSLFVGPKGMTSQLHVDAFGSHFWMALFKGVKRWTFYTSSDTPYLYPEYHHSLDPVFQADTEKPDLESHQLLSLATPTQVYLQEGEILYVPAGSPHRVENMTDSVAISGNFVDLSNLDLVKQELKAQALTDPRAEDLLDKLSHVDIDYEQLYHDKKEHLPFEIYKDQHNKTIQDNINKK